MSQKWYRFENQDLSHIKDNDVWLYAREYKADTGYKGGPVNSLVLNFKKSPSSKKNKLEWSYRKKAVRQFKEDVEPLLKTNPKGGILTAVPSSKTKDHPEYNSRFEDLFKEILKSLPGWQVEWPVEIKENQEPAHRSGERSPEFFKKNYIWKGFKYKEPKILCIFDDVITTGSHLRAMSDFLRENKYTGKIIGICWAKTIWE